MTIIIDFDKEGKILQQTVVSINDDSLAKILTRVIEETQGMWVNHSGSNQTAVLPVYWEYDDLKTIHHTIYSMEAEKWTHSNRGNLIFLKPLKAECRKPVK
jgi:hypothetical protein